MKDQRATPKAKKLNIRLTGLFLFFDKIKNAKSTLKAVVINKETILGVNILDIVKLKSAIYTTNIEIYWFVEQILEIFVNQLLPQ